MKTILTRRLGIGRFSHPFVCFARMQGQRERKKKYLENRLSFATQSSSALDRGIVDYQLNE